MLLLYLRVDKFAQPVPAFKNISYYYYINDVEWGTIETDDLKTSHVTIICSEFCYRKQI